MKYIVVDLEMNKVAKGSEARGICSQETIEIGAVMLDENYREISAFRTYVKPEYNDIIVRKIVKLTGITTEMVQNAPKFNEAFRMFTNWCLGCGDDIRIFAWSESDFLQISKEVLLKQYEAGEEEMQKCLTPWNDFQKEFDTHLGFEKQVSLKMALEMAGILFEGRQHDALDDARNTAELFQVFSDKELFETTLRKIEEIMKPTPLGVSLGDFFDMSQFLAEVC